MYARASNNGIDVVRTLENYVADGCLKSTTQFITIDVENLYTMIPRQGALEALARFRVKHAKQGKIGTLSTDHIMKMARLILDTSCFAYNNKYYRQIRGGAMGSAFTQVLANIYMFEWEQQLIQHQIEHKGIYGRFVTISNMNTIHMYICCPFLFRTGTSMISSWQPTKPPKRSVWNWRKQGAKM